MGANDILDDELAWNDIRGFLVDGCGKFIANEVRKYLANAAKSDGAAATADQSPIEVDVIA